MDQAGEGIHSYVGNQRYRLSRKIGAFGLAEMMALLATAAQQSSM
jgi:hypothetical protein